ncbi:hypothetical protein FEM03_09695 [Phragmitibacter flavus]|uniref:DUF4175 family protein n=1 Tax=Phragmitibacter flavus TaxID=2576071 RepID=A0A5R8KHS8_9BACT|nr:hypothetical protein [Phragmitibacter flavus]TLD71169.1 hypothetical protein FEM03_09695 [Phragmitibacter flavus]
MTTPLPPILEEKLAAFRRRVWLIKLTEGLLAGLFGLALSYLLVFVLDRFFETPTSVRLAILLTGTSVLALGLPLKWHRWVWRQRKLEDAARLIRKKFPRLGDQLLGLVELAHLESGQGGRSETLVRAAMQQTAEAVKDRDFTEAVPHARHRPWAFACTALLAIAIAALILVPDAARNALARWLTPWQNIERYTFARVEKLPSTLVVPIAENFDLNIQLAANTQWTPQSANARIPNQPTLTAGLDPKKTYPFTFPAQKADTTLSLRLGDIRQTLQLHPRPRPELTHLTAHLRLPSYLQYKTEPQQEIHSGTFTLLRGTEAAIEATASRDLAHAEMDGQIQTVKAATIRTSYRQIENPTQHQLTWRDQHGLTPREPLTLTLNPTEDQPPKVNARRDSNEQVILETETITLDLNINDDYGVREAGLEWQGLSPAPDGKTLTGSKITGGGNPEARQFETRATFSPARDKVPPQTIELRAWATDYLPDRPRTRSTPFLLHILNPTDHALWLTDQFSRWLQVARESYDREQQLHETNRELRALSPSELDRPENRRRAQQQAAAETANANRLDQLTDSGRDLVKQATRNPEFDGARLESLATLLKSLDSIAETRMPSVADLLKQSSTAPTKPSSSSSSSPPKPSPTDSATKPDSSSAPTDPNSPQSPSPVKSSSSSLSSSSPKNDPQTPQSPSKPSDPDTQSSPSPSPTPPQPPSPSLPPDKLASHTQTPPPPTPPSPPKPPTPPKFSLPKTTLGAAPGDAPPPPPESPAQRAMENAVTEQKDLLEEFAKVTDQLSEILSSLEASTFVKRLKAASKKQLTISTDLNQKTLTAFGLTTNPTPANATPIVTRQKTEAETVRIIQSDLEAFQQRKPDLHFRKVLDQMRETEIVRALSQTPERTEKNLSGQSIVSAEHWADILDRWAEEMVAASNCSNCSAASGPSLPPEIVLKVMQALRDEMNLRDETRELDTAKSALSAELYVQSAAQLTKKQQAIRDLTHSAIDDINALPRAKQNFEKELALLTRVTFVMTEARDLLAKPDTGAPTVAAETEAIELLLQAQRQPPGGGGGGGGDPGGGGTAQSASATALSELGPGSDAKAQPVQREVKQSTGKAGREFPEEFKNGLDTYFNTLESSPEADAQAP